MRSVYTRFTHHGFFPYIQTQDLPYSCNAIGCHITARNGFDVSFLNFANDETSWQNNNNTLLYYIILLYRQRAGCTCPGPGGGTGDENGFFFHFSFFYQRPLLHTVIYLFYPWNLRIFLDRYNITSLLSHSPRTFSGVLFDRPLNHTRVRLSRIPGDILRKHVPQVIIILLHVNNNVVIISIIENEEFE